MATHLFKVAAPRVGMDFYPSVFWHTPDWESSTTRQREGYIRDEVLYAGDFDEVSIHLFPRVRTVRVSAVDAPASSLRELGLNCTEGKTAHIFINASYRSDVESFRPTIFRFDPDGFVRVRKGEYVSWQPQRAASVETVSIEEAIERWNIQACYVDDLDQVIECLRRENIYFEEQS